jgi:ribonucleotide monophosphatase NagD (HAD superfamily)
MCFMVRNNRSCENLIDIDGVVWASEQPLPQTLAPIAAIRRWLLWHMGLH